MNKAGLILLLLVVSTQSFAKAKRWVMMCKGGPGMTGSLFFDKETIVRRAKALLQIKFKRGKAGVNKRKPRPGECTWLNRGMRKNEPTVAWYVSSKRHIISKWKVTHKGIYPKRGNRAKSIVHAIRNQKFFYIHVKGVKFKKGKASRYKIVKIGP